MPRFGVKSSTRALHAGAIRVQWLQLPPSFDTLRYSGLTVIVGDTMTRQH